MKNVLSYATVVAQVAMAGVFAFALGNASVLCGVLAGLVAFLCIRFKSLDTAAPWGPWERVFNGLFSLGVIAYFVLSLVYHWPYLMEFYAVIGGAAWGIIAFAILRSLFVKHQPKA